MSEELEELIKTKGRLEVSHDEGGGGMGLYWCATVGGEWPYCHGETFDDALADLLSEHRRLEREALQERINAIDGAAQL